MLVVEPFLHVRKVMILEQGALKKASPEAATPFVETIPSVGAV